MEKLKKNSVQVTWKIADLSVPKNTCAHAHGIQHRGVYLENVIFNPKEQNPFFIQRWKAVCQGSSSNANNTHLNLIHKNNRSLFLVMNSILWAAVFLLCFIAVTSSNKGHHWISIYISAFLCGSVNDAENCNFRA